MNKPEFYLLGVVHNKLEKRHSRGILYMESSGRLLYAQWWKNNETPTVENWIVKMSEFEEMTKYLLRRWLGVNEDSQSSR